MFQIEWTRSALDDLARAWGLAASELRNDITAAAFEAERRLQHRPDIAGESREPGKRLLIVNPLWATFHVNVRTNTVLISAVQVHQREQ